MPINSVTYPISMKREAMAACMALEIADESARADIECIGQAFTLADVAW